MEKETKSRKTIIIIIAIALVAIVAAGIIIFKPFATDDTEYTDDGSEYIADKPTMEDLDEELEEEGIMTEDQLPDVYVAANDKNVSRDTNASSDDESTSEKKETLWNTTERKIISATKKDTESSSTDSKSSGKSSGSSSVSGTSGKSVAAAKNSSNSSSSKYPDGGVGSKSEKNSEVVINNGNEGEEKTVYVVTYDEDYRSANGTPYRSSYKNDVTVASLLGTEGKAAKDYNIDVEKVTVTGLPEELSAYASYDTFLKAAGEAAKCKDSEAEEFTISYVSHVEYSVGGIRFNLKYNDNNIVVYLSKAQML